MRFLHVFDTAGVGALLSHELTKMGHNSAVVQLSQLDPFDFGKYYKNTIYCSTDQEVIDTANDMDADHIIVHDYAIYLDRLKHRTKSIFYHGSQLRHMYGKSDIDRSASAIFISTADLWKERPQALLVNRPVDRSLFSTFDSPKVGGLTITNARHWELIMNELPPNTAVRIRNDKIIPYQEMPLLLDTYNTYYDYKWDYSHPPKPINEYSITGLQALSMGLRVVTRWDEQTGFPSFHDSKVVAKEFLKHFE